MKRSSCSSARLTLSLAILLCARAVAAPAPVEAYGQRPAMIDVDINPAGTRLAWIEDDGTKSRLVIHDLATHKPLRLLDVPKENRLRRLLWATDETLLLDQSVTITRTRSKSRDLVTWQRWMAIDASGGSDRMLLMDKSERGWVTGATLVRRITSRPGKVFMSTLEFSNVSQQMETGTRLAGGREDSAWLSTLFEVDVKTGGSRVLAYGTPFTFDWLTDEGAERVVRSEWNPAKEEFEILFKNAAGWRTLHKATGCGRLNLLSLSSDRQAVLVRGPTCAQARQTLWSLPIDGSPIQPLVDDPSLEVQGTLFDTFDGQAIAAILGGVAPTTRWLDPQAEKRRAALGRSFKDSRISVISRSADHLRVVVLVENAQSPPVYYLINYDAKSADIINERYPKLAGVPLGAVRDFRYQARDQYPLFAYLTLPPGATEKSLPVVVLPHGGPESRDDADFDYLTQFLASRGYAVLQPQFRGSSGFGKAHADAGRQQWGLRMQDDVTDGVQALISQGIADPRRICIVGGSYGGYSALAGAAFTPELYACAASINGVSDLPVMIGTTSKEDGKESNAYAYWREHIGSATHPQVIAKSPARSAATFKAPVLLIHGQDDTVVSIEQSRIMAKALKAAGKQVELVELEGDDHHLSNSVTRVRTLRELEKFLGTHLAASPATP